MLTLADLADRHAGERILICGTGPSLDAVDALRVTGPRIFIHRAAFAMPRSKDETYWLVNDNCWRLGTLGPWHRLLEAIRAGTADMLGVFRDPMGDNGKPSPAPQGRNICRWHGFTEDAVRALQLTREEVLARNVLYMEAGTGATAVHLAWVLGAREVVLAGFDGGEGHAQCVAEFYEQPDTRGGLGYLPAQDCVENALTQLNMQATMIKEEATDAGVH